jgi:hypothetical protein
MKRIACLCLSTTLALGALACAGPLFKNYGRIDPSHETTLTLENHSVIPAFRYYVSGPDLTPNALMGLHRDYRLDPATLWKEVEMSPEKMKALVENMRSRAFDYGQFPAGFDLIDDKGVRIGLWYSITTARTLVRMQEDGTVRVDTPELNPYERRYLEIDARPN